MNSPFVNNLAERNEIFQKIIDTLKESPYIKELTMGQLEEITHAPRDRIEKVLMAMSRKGGLGKYVIGRSRLGGPRTADRFIFSYKPEDVVNASLDPEHEPAPVESKPSRSKNVIKNDAGNVVPVTNTRERHISVSVHDDEIEIHLSRGMQIDFESLRNLITHLQ